MKRDEKGVERLQKIQIAFDEKITQMEKDGKEMDEKESRYTDADTDIHLLCRYYIRDGEKFAIKKMRDYHNNFGSVAVEFVGHYKGKPHFYKVEVAHLKNDDRIVKTYKASILLKGRSVEKYWTSDKFDVLKDDERAIICKIEKYKEIAEYCKFLDAVGIMK